MAQLSRGAEAPSHVPALPQIRASPQFSRSASTTRVPTPTLTPVLATSAPTSVLGSLRASPRGQLGRRTPGTMSMPSLDEPSDRLASRYRHHRTSMAPRRLAPLGTQKGPSTLDRASTRLTTRLRSLNTSMSQMKHALQDPDSSSYPDKPVELTELRTQVAKQLVSKAEQADLGPTGGLGCPAVLQLGSPWRRRAFSQAMVVRAPIPHSPLKLLSPRVRRLSKEFPRHARNLRH